MLSGKMSKTVIFHSEHRRRHIYRKRFQSRCTCVAVLAIFASLVGLYFGLWIRQRRINLRTVPELISALPNLLTSISPSFSIPLWKHLRKQLPCPLGCLLRGNCNEEVGQCRCPRGYASPSCSELAMPRCNLSPEYTIPGCHFGISCSCILDCDRLAIPNAGVCREDNLGNGTFETDISKLFDLPLVKIYMDGKGNTTGKRVPVKPNELENFPESRLTNPINCKSNCSGIGGCEKGHCRCPFGHWSETCKPDPNPFGCPNNCSGFGECRGHFCKCKEGYFGVDCAVFFGAAGKPQLVSRPPFLWTNAVPPIGQSERSATHPKVYIYDLPGEWNTWLMGSSLHGADFPMELLFFERMLGSPHRTADADEADFFYVPLFLRAAGGYAGQRISSAIQYIAATWPFYNRSNGADHVFVTGSDWGNCQFTPTYGSFFPPLLNSITVTAWGYTRAMQPSENPVENRPCFRKGVDISIPAMEELPNFSLVPWLLPKEVRDREDRNRTILLYFSGYRGENGTGSGWVRSNGVRQEFMDRFYGRDNETGFQLSISGREAQRQDQKRSVFCFGPCGYGWGQRPIQAVLLGCIPVVIQPDVVMPYDGDVVDWREFAVMLERKDIRKLPEVLRALSRDAEFLRRKRAAMAAVWARFVWMSPHRNPLQELDLPGDRLDDLARGMAAMDVVSSVMQALGKRSARK